MSELEATQYCETCKKNCPFLFSGSGTNGTCGNCGSIKDKWDGRGLMSYNG